ncbi:hypothetical protein REPUB_Repub16aG0117600 [Reevesia pubescens]
MWMAISPSSSVVSMDGPASVEKLVLKVTNRATKDEEIVRIVDSCGTGPLEMDLETAFNPIDTDGSAHKLGHLVVDYEFVDCGDSSQENTVLVFSE